MTDRVFNFSAGPSTLPREVLEEAARELPDYSATGMSLVEMSHRGPHYSAVHAEATGLVRSVLGVPDDFDIMWLQGGATLQFSMVPMNLLGPDDRAGYVVSGSWGKKALGDAATRGGYAAWDGADSGFTRLPASDELSLESGTRYLHVTSNETIGGIQMFDWPDVGVPLVADMSSDYAMRPVPWERFDLVYGGAQKNLGPAGVTIVIARKSVVAESDRGQGAYLRYDIHADKDSMYNTPPVFAIWMVGKVLRWVADRGGVEAMEKAARQRAAVLYDAIDSAGGFYRSPVEEASRSLMNVVFRLPSEELEGAFIAEAADRGMSGLKGHRSVGGCRASIYNAMPLDGVESLASFMSEFKAEHG